MTTRDQVRRAATDLRSGSDRAAIAPEPAASLPERLLAARERKGVDLYRAERDTKIRARYLGALERGDYKELPGAVYTKGFLRNYALYLGLDPDEILVQWRRERGDTREVQPVIATPRPLTVPRQGLTFSPGIFIGVVLTLLVVAFVVYLGVQLARFTKPPTIAVSDPASVVSEVDDSSTTYTLRGTTSASATVKIATAGRDQPYQVTADEDGNWTAQVDLRRGPNQFEVSAVDPDTQKNSDDKVTIRITVPYPTIEAPNLAISSPDEGAQYENGAIPVTGTVTNAATVTVAATFVGPVTPARPAASGKPSSSVPPAPAPVTVKPSDDGSFTAPLALTAGKWQITVTAASAENKTVALTRNVTVSYKGLNLVVSIKGGRAWMKVWVDGQVSDVTGAGGRTFNEGKTLTFTAEREIIVWTGASSRTRFTLNGQSLGALGTAAVPETWSFTPSGQPKRAQHP